MTRVVIIFLSILIVCEPAIPKGSFYWENRHFDCVNYGDDRTRCTLTTDNKNDDLNPNCFDELDQNNVTHTYCGLQCEESLEATLVKKTPSVRDCVQYYTYNLERRRQDWFLWRNGSCADSTINFHIICGTPANPKVFYRQNAHLFEYEDASD